MKLALGHPNHTDCLVGRDDMRRLQPPYSRALTNIHDCKPFLTLLHRWSGFGRTCPSSLSYLFLTWAWRHLSRPHPIGWVTRHHNLIGTASIDGSCHWLRLIPSRIARNFTRSHSFACLSESTFWCSFPCMWFQLRQLYRLFPLLVCISGIKHISADTFILQCCGNGLSSR